VSGFGLGCNIDNSWLIIGCLGGKIGPRKSTEGYQVNRVSGCGYEDMRISEYQVAVIGTPYGGHQGDRDFDTRRTV